MNHQEEKKHSNRKHSLLGRLFVILRIPALLIIIYLVTGIIASQKLEVNYYTIPSKQIVNPVRIVHLSDLHSREYGPGNQELIELVKAQNPDIICMTGDMFSRHEDDLSVAFSLVEKLTEIADVFYSYGNHEIDYEKRTNTSLYPMIEEKGAYSMDSHYMNVEVNGNNLCIGGSAYNYRNWEIDFYYKEYQDLFYSFADDFEASDGYHILLTHIPTTLVYEGGVDEFDVDLSFCGHYHGGVFRIPFIDRGVYVPKIGLFPKHTKGVTTGQKGSCVQSAGLGNEHLIPRVFNPPEVVVVDLVSAS